MRLWMFVGAGTVLMLGVFAYGAISYKIPIWKSLLSAVFLALFGVLGTKIMAFIEMGRWAGKSFFGAIFFTPIFMIILAFMIRVRIGEMLDLCAPAECAMLIVMKIQCVIDGCCYGRILHIDDGGYATRFPSQITECIFALLLTIIFMYWLIHKKHYNQLYAIYMIIYGAGRFVLNFFRETSPFIWVLPAGNFWSLVSVVLGLLILFYTNKYFEVKKENNIREAFL